MVNLALPGFGTSVLVLVLGLTTTFMYTLFTRRSRMKGLVGYTLQCSSSLECAS